jgi:ATP-binding cassette subfamily F protein 3
VLYRLDGVRVAFGGREVLRGASLQQGAGERLSLLGRNGSGKTTLLRVISGELEPDGGVVERAGDLQVTRVKQHLDAVLHVGVMEYCLGAFAGLVDMERETAALQPRLDGSDVEALARFHALQEDLERMDAYRARARAAAALEGLSIPSEFHQRPLGALSGGERTRVALARALLSPAPLLLLDEPTNHLDLLGVEFLAAELAARQTAVLLVSHDRTLVDRLGGEILELHGGRIERYRAGYDRYRRERAHRRAIASKAWELQRAEIARQEEFIRRNIAGQNTRQAQARQKLLDRMPRLEAPEPEVAAVRLRWPQSGRSGDRVLDAEGLLVGWHEPLLRDVEGHLRRGGRLALVGRNGAGKSTLLRTLAGLTPALGGAIRFGVGVVPGMYDQETAEVLVDASVLEVLLAARPDWAPADARSWAGRFGFSGETAEAAPQTLSGGERARLNLARLLAVAPNLVLLDEPTNHLDIPTCEALEEALLEYPGAVVLVSHDRRLVEVVATDVLLLDEGRATPYHHAADAFARLGLGASRTRPERDTDEPAPRRSPEEEERRRLRRDAARARDRADALAAHQREQEKRLTEIEALLCERDVYSDPRRASELAREGEEIRAALDGLLDAWTEAEEDAEALALRLVELGG